MAQFIDKLNQLKAAQTKLAEQEQAVLVERQRALASLPSDYGFASLNDFIKALKAAAGKSGKGGRARRAAAKSAKRGRVRVTPELRAQVIAAVEAGKPGSQIVEEFGVSIATVQNIKKAAGLVKPREADATPANVPPPLQ